MYKERETYIEGVRHVLSMNGWMPHPASPQQLWTEKELKAVAAFQCAQIEQQARAANNAL